MESRRTTVAQVILNELSRWSPEGDAATFVKGYFVDGLEKKIQPDSGVTPAARKAAYDKFMEVEKRNFHTNRRFADYAEEGALFRDLPARVQVFLRDVRAFCVNFVRDFSVGPGCFGPGSVFESRGDGEKTMPGKIVETASCTKSLGNSFLRKWSDSAWGRVNQLYHMNHDYCPLPSRVRGSRWACVAKTAEIARSINVEPSINVHFQMAVGQELRRRLQRVSLLSDQEEVSFFGCRAPTSQGVHRKLAQLGSRGDIPIATIDLSDASNSIAFSVVEYLFGGTSLYQMLLGLRSPYTKIRVGNVDHWYLLEMFSAMGNGFTFELETLIFYAICRHVASHEVTVFGDDIICHQDDADNIIAALTFFGFQKNLKKTFVSGPFRESCGGDFYEGQYCRPVFLRKELEDPLDIIDLHNKVVERYQGWLPNDSLMRILRCMRQLIPNQFRLYGPYGLAGVLWSPLWERRSYPVFWERYDDSRGKKSSRVLSYRCVMREGRTFDPSRFGVPSLLVASFFGLRQDSIGVPGDRGCCVVATQPTSAVPPSSGF